MGCRLFLAGAGGVVGKRLVPLLLNAGHEVFGTTRSPTRADELRTAGVEPVVIDVFDAEQLMRTMTAIRPHIVIHQLTDLPRGLDPARMGEAITRNARIRDEGTRNLVEAANAAGVLRVIAQSIVWAYAPGREPHVEDDALDLAAEGLRAISVGGVAALEHWILDSPPIEGVVLRYGQIYGPGTGTDEPAGSAPLHVDAAASAAMLAIDTNARGVFNIAEPNAYASSDKARRELGWQPGFRQRDLAFARD